MCEGGVKGRLCLAISERKRGKAGDERKTKMHRKKGEKRSARWMQMFERWSEVRREWESARCQWGNNKAALISLRRLAGREWWTSGTRRRHSFEQVVSVGFLLKNGRKKTSFNRIFQTDLFLYLRFCFLFFTNVVMSHLETMSSWQVKPQDLRPSCQVTTVLQLGIRSLTSDLSDFKFY